LSAAGEKDDEVSARVILSRGRLSRALLAGVRRRSAPARPPADDLLLLLLS
jgi:hypothetical protein